MAKMDEDKLKSILSVHVADAKSYINKLTIERQRNLDYYYAEPFGNEQEDASQVVLSDVQDVIESVMPDMMEIFAGGQNIVEYTPNSEEDTPLAEQATDYANFIWNRDNDGYVVSHDWIKDALLMKTGVVKVYWDEQETTRTYYQSGVDPEQLLELKADEEVEILEIEEAESSMTPVQPGQPQEMQPQMPPEGMGMGQPPMEPMQAMPQQPQMLPGQMPLNPEPITLYNVKLKRTKKGGRVKVENVPLEEFLVSSQVPHEDEAPYIGHYRQVTKSDLIEMGYSRDKVMALPPGHDEEFDYERQNRFEGDGGFLSPVETPLDPAMQTVWLYEAYIRVDYDGDGKAELRRVISAGPDDTILDNEEVDDHPFCLLTPIRMPHKLFGRALADLVRDIQLIKSTVMRQGLDNMYGLNNNRALINERVDIDDWLANRPGGYVRVAGNEPVGDSVQPIPPQSIGPIVVPMMEYWDSVRETRVGVTRYNQGLDANSLNKTATGISQIMGRAQKRSLMIARMFAETGYRKAFSKIRALLVEHQQQARTIRLRNKWVRVDPRVWNADMDTMVNVALGTGTREQLSAQLVSVLQAQKEIIQFQGGVEGPLVGVNELYNTFKLWLHSMGIKNDEAHVMDPVQAKEEGKVSQPKPDPEVQKAQMLAQIEQQKLQGTMQIDQQKMQSSIELEQFKAQTKAQSDQAAMQAKMQMDRERMMFDMQMEREKAAHQIELERIKADAKMSLDAAMAESNARNAAMLAEKKASVMKPNGAQSREG